MLEGGDGVAGAVFELENDKLNVPALAALLAEIAGNKEKYQSMRAAVPAATEKFDPAVLARKHDVAYRAALDPIA